MQAPRARTLKQGFMLGMLGTGMTGITNGALNIAVESAPPSQRIPTLDSYYEGRIAPEKLAEAVENCAKSKQPLHDTLMQLAGWPEIPFDGTLLMSHQDVLLKGGKVQAAAGFADHVTFADPAICAKCREHY